MSCEEKSIVNALIKNLILSLMDDYGMNMENAMTEFFNSELYAKILDMDSGFYCQSAGHNYQYLRHELETGKLV